MSSSPPTVLVVDDEPRIADLYAKWLESDYSVVVANDGEAALEALDDRIDVVLLDRRMPGLTGDEVLERITDEGLDCWVAMVTAVEPDFDILAMGFDDYAVKPVSREEVRDLVDRLMAREAYDAGLREHFAAVSKWAALAEKHPPETLTSNEEFRNLERAITEQREHLNAVLSDLSSTDFRQVLRDAVGETDTALEFYHEE